MVSEIPPLPRVIGSPGGHACDVPGALTSVRLFEIWTPRKISESAGTHVSMSSPSSLYSAVVFL